VREKHRLEEVLARTNVDLKDKNEKILDLLQSIEDFKIEIYSRDKSISIFQDQIKRLSEDLREAKQYEHKYKAVYTMKLSLENEN